MNPASAKKAVYKRIVLKISGEALQGRQGYGVDPKIAGSIADEIREVHGLGVEVVCVVGAGNIFRGLEAARSGMDRVTADYIGMLATIINSLVLQDALEKRRVHTRVQTAIEIHQLAEPYIRRRAVRHLEKGRVVVLAGGTGNPYFTTDSAAALRAIEIGADVILKATKVEGVYDRDPEKDRRAKKFDRLSYLEVLKRRLSVMDSTAISLAMDNHLPIVVFNLMRRGNIRRVVVGEKVGTRVE